jgi:Acyl-CoA hydrolase
MCKASEEKRVSDSQTEQIHVVVPQHLNGAGTLFGGQLAFWIDEVGGVTAARHCHRRVTTAAIDNLRFREPVYQGELLVLLGRVTFTGETSLEVRVDSFAENLSGQRRLINTAYVIMVALGEDGQPCKVPQLTPKTPEEERSFAAGQQRKLYRMQMARELYE